MMSMDDNWQSDLARYPVNPFLREQSIWAVWIYRHGHRILQQNDGVSKAIRMKLFWLMYRIIETGTGITLPPTANIGPGLRIWHFGNIIIHPNAVIGANCTLRQGVTIGNRYPDGPAPIIGDNVDCGAYAQILGGIRIGSNCKIGAMSVVLGDLPNNATAVGIPAKIVSIEKT